MRRADKLLWIYLLREVLLDESSYRESSALIHSCPWCPWTHGSVFTCIFLTFYVLTLPQRPYLFFLQWSWLLSCVRVFSQSNTIVTRGPGAGECHGVRVTRNRECQVPARPSPAHALGSLSILTPEHSECIYSVYWMETCSEETVTQYQWKCITL